MDFTIIFFLLLLVFSPIYIIRKPVEERDFLKRLPYFLISSFVIFLFATTTIFFSAVNVAPIFELSTFLVLNLILLRLTVRRIADAGGLKFWSILVYIFPILFISFSLRESRSNS